MDEVTHETERSLLPRFTIRALLALLTVSAFAFLVAGMAYRGQYWAWGVTIGIASLLVTAVVHATLFGIIWSFARMNTTRTAEKG